MRTPLVINFGVLCVSLGLACGPGQPGDPSVTEDAGGPPGTSSTGPDTPTGTSAGVPTSGEPDPSATTSEPPDTGDTFDPIETSTGESTGEPVDCAVGPVPFAPLWSTVIGPPLPFIEVTPEGGMTTMADGRVAIAVKIRDGEPLLSAGGVMFLARTGELLGVHPAGFGKNGPIHGLARADSDELVLAGTRLGVEPEPTWVARLGADGSLLADHTVSQPNNFTAALGLLDTPLLLGLAGSELRAVKYTADGAGVEWALPMVGPGLPQPAAVASRADGTALLVTQDDPGPAGFRWLGLRLVDSAGETRWTREFDGLAFAAAPDAVAVPGAWVVLRSDRNKDGVVRLMAVAEADGALLWDVEVAAPDEQGPPLATRVHWTGEQLTVPVMRTRASDLLADTDTRTVAAHRVGLDGALQDATGLSGAAAIKGQWALQSAVGACGELIVLAPGDGRTWVGGFGP